MNGVRSDALLAQLEALHPKVIDLSLGRIERLLAALGHPERRLPPVIHIAGTNGKGSTLAFLRAALNGAGLAVHAYTSPHLVRFHERIELAGAPIGEEALCALLQRVEAANGGKAITFFEITTAAAFLAFAETPADVLLLEVGLGGRLDATNVIDRPLVSCIAPVGIDHQGFLGDSLAEIAGEKAGIAKPGVPLVLAAQAPDADRVIREHARRAGAPLHAEGEDWRLGEDNVFRGRDWHVALPPVLPLPGKHQRHNAALALACLELAAGRFGLNAAGAASALAKARWPARLQELTGTPLGGRLPAGVRLFLDGGHNAHAAAALADWAAAQEGPVHLVTALLSNRAPGAYLAPFAGHIASVTAVPIGPGHDGHDPETIAAEARALGLDATTAPGVAAALDKLDAGLAKALGAPATVLIAGSLYLAGSVLAGLENAA